MGTEGPGPWTLERGKDDGGELWVIRDGEGNYIAECWDAETAHRIVAGYIAEFENAALKAEVEGWKDAHEQSAGAFQSLTADLARVTGERDEALGWRETARTWERMCNEQSHRADTATAEVARLRAALEGAEREREEWKRLAGKAAAGEAIAKGQLSAARREARDSLLVELEQEYAKGVFSEHMLSVVTRIRAALAPPPQDAGGGVVVKPNAETMAWWSALAPTASRCTGCSFTARGFTNIRTDCPEHGPNRGGQCVTAAPAAAPTVSCSVCWASYPESESHGCRPAAPADAGEGYQAPQIIDLMEALRNSLKPAPKPSDGEG
jgi:hypothetical protein